MSNQSNKGFNPIYINKKFRFGCTWLMIRQMEEKNITSHLIWIEKYSEIFTPKEIFQTEVHNWKKIVHSPRDMTSDHLRMVIFTREELQLQEWCVILIELSHITQRLYHPWGVSCSVNMCLLSTPLGSIHTDTCLPTLWVSPFTH